jgi:hypothetical protein
MNRTFLLLVLMLLLAAPSIQAAEPRMNTNLSSSLAAQDIVSQVWDLLTSLWADNGCGIDPSGRCLPEPSPTANTDNGCSADPDGRCGS